MAATFAVALPKVGTMVCPSTTDLQVGQHSLPNCMWSNWNTTRFNWYPMIKMALLVKSYVGMIGNQSVPYNLNGTPSQIVCRDDYKYGLV